MSTLLYKEAIKRFIRFQQLVRKSKVNEPTSMILSTATSRGMSSSRVVLLKEGNERGFVFFTNSKSRKGKELQENSHASLCFFWDSLPDDQIRIEGYVEPVSDVESDAYWASRPRLSQLGAWASLQSENLLSRADFVKRLSHFRSLYKGKDVPRPAHWFGYRLVPHMLEFWKRGAYRLHHRTCYTKTRSGWTKKLLYP